METFGLLVLQNPKLSKLTSNSFLIAKIRGSESHPLLAWQRDKLLPICESRPICKKVDPLSSTGPKFSKKSRPTPAEEGSRSGPFFRHVGRFCFLIFRPLLLNGLTFLQIGRLSRIGSTQSKPSQFKTFTDDPTVDGQVLATFQSSCSWKVEHPKHLEEPIQ